MVEFADAKSGCNHNATNAQAPGPVCVPVPTYKVNGGNSGYGGNTGQQQFLQGPPTPSQEGKLPHCFMQHPLPAEVSAAAESLQKLLLSGVTPCPEVPPFTLV